MILTNTTYYPLGEGSVVTLGPLQIRSKKPQVEVFKSAILDNMRARWAREDEDGRTLIECQRLAFEDGHVDAVWLRDGPRPWPARFTIGIYQVEFHPLEEEAR